MANWSLLQEQLTGLEVVKRTKHGIHFKQGNQILAHFSGAPCHYLDGGIWKPIDTKLLLMPDGYYGCPHSPVRIHKDGHVKVDGTDYIQYTALVNPSEGLVDNDRIVRDFTGGRQYLYVTEGGFRQEIVLDSIPSLKLNEAKKLIATVYGNLPIAYVASLLTATDANGDTYTYDTVWGLIAWLTAAAYPVVIDPDFAVETNDTVLLGITTISYKASRELTNPSITQSSYYGTITQWKDGIQYRVGKAFLKFDTSSIGAGSTVTQVNLKLAENFGTRTVGVYIVPYDWSSNDPITTDNKETVFTGVIGVTGEQGFTVIDLNGTTSSNLTATIVSKTSYTYLSVMGAQDYAETENYDGTLESSLVYMCMSGHATESKRPILAVVYEAGATGLVTRRSLLGVGI